MIFHCEWRYVETRINPRRAKKPKKNFGFFFCKFIYYYFWGK